jgi:hypothetical protein
MHHANPQTDTRTGNGMHASQRQDQSTNQVDSQRGGAMAGGPQSSLLYVNPLLTPEGQQLFRAPLFLLNLNKRSHEVCAMPQQ